MAIPLGQKSGSWGAAGAPCGGVQCCPSQCQALESDQCSTHPQNICIGLGCLLPRLGVAPIHVHPPSSLPHMSESALNQIPQPCLPCSPPAQIRDPLPFPPMCGSGLLYPGCLLPQPPDVWIGIWVHTPCIQMGTPTLVLSAG